MATEMTTDQSFKALVSTLSGAFYAIPVVGSEQAHIIEERIDQFEQLVSAIAERHAAWPNEEHVMRSLGCQAATRALVTRLVRACDAALWGGGEWSELEDAVIGLYFVVDMCDQDR